MKVLFADFRLSFMKFVLQIVKKGYAYFVFNIKNRIDQSRDKALHL